MLNLIDVNKEYGEFRLQVNMQVKKGYVTGLVGRNGAGKSTLFKAILGLIRIDGGEIEILPNEGISGTIAKKQLIGVSFADSGFSQYLNIKRIAGILRGMYPNFNRKQFYDNCEKWKLPLNKAISSFSTGMKAKLKILVATSYDARFLILDEPTAGLDVVAREEVSDILRDYMLEEGRAILISSHISSDLEGLCDDIYMIDEGKIILHEETDDLRDKYGILRLTDEQMKSIDKEYLIKIRKEPLGYTALTDCRAFYEENYKDAVIEKGNLDDIISLMTRGDDR